MMITERTTLGMKSSGKDIHLYDYMQMGDRNIFILLLEEKTKPDKCLFRNGK